MFAADPSVGHFVSGGIVGGTAPLALGPALAFKLSGSNGVTAAFFGDGAAQQGTVLESMNLAIVWQLPLVFVCDNNGFGQATPISYAAGSPLVERAAGFGMESQSVDGQDVEAVVEASKRAVERARSGGGPSFLDIQTASYRGSWEGEPKVAYRSEHQREYRARDPLVILSRRIKSQDPDWEAKAKAIHDTIRTEMDAAFDAARAAAPPLAEEVFANVYAGTSPNVDRNGLVLGCPSELTLEGVQ